MRDFQTRIDCHPDQVATEQQHAQWLHKSAPLSKAERVASRYPPPTRVHRGSAQRPSSAFRRFVTSLAAEPVVESERQRSKAGIENRSWASRGSASPRYQVSNRVTIILADHKRHNRSARTAAWLLLMNRGTLRRFTTRPMSPSEALAQWGHVLRALAYWGAPRFQYSRLQSIWYTRPIMLSIPECFLDHWRIINSIRSEVEITLALSSNGRIHTGNIMR